MANLCHDGVLRMEVPGKVNLVAYADDLALVISGKSVE